MSFIPYFHSQALMQRFAHDVQYAVQAAHITPAQGLWLQRLLDAPPAGQESSPARPRVDRLVCDTGAELGAELAAAWLISDTGQPQAPVFLSTLAYGIERFADRASLTAALNVRFLAWHPQPPDLEAEHVEGDPFEQRMLAIVDQQAGHLEALAEQLDRLPSLPGAIGGNLQQRVDAQFPHGGTDVFRHLVQVLGAGTGEEDQVVGTLSLAEAAFQSHGAGDDGDEDDEASEPDRSLRLRFMDGQGALLDAPQAAAWQALLGEAATNLLGYFEGLLSQYWAATHGDGTTARDFAIRSLAEAWRHELLGARAAQALSPMQAQQLAAMLGVPDASSATTVGRAWQLSLELDEGSPKLAGVVVLELEAGQDTDDTPGLYLLSSRHGIRRFANRQRLEQHYRSPAGQAELPAHVSLNEHEALRTQTLQRLRLDLIEQALLPRMLDSVIALQKRNLEHVLGLPAMAPARAAVRVDDALDIRHLLDGRLVGLHDTRRWVAGRDSFARHWSPAHGFAHDGLAALVLFDPAQFWFRQLGELDRCVQWRFELCEDAAECMRHSLNRYLAVSGGPSMDARDLWVQGDDMQPVRLIAMALERVSGRLAGLPEGLRLLDDHAAPALQALPARLLQWLLVQVSQDFAWPHDRHQRRFLSRPLRWLDSRVDPGAIDCQVRESALRLQLSMARRAGTLDSHSLEMFQQVLDRPQRALRGALGEQRVEVQGVQLRLAADELPVRVNDVLVLSRDGQHVLWALPDGLSHHASLDAVQERLVDRLSGPSSRQAWLALFDQADRARLQALDGAGVLKLELQRLDGHFIQGMQQAAVERRSRALAQALAQARFRKLPAELLRDVLKAEACDDRNHSLLDVVGLNMEVMRTDELLPAWMKQASMMQLLDLAALIQRWYVACHSGKDFLFGIPEPRQYARDKLLARLRADFPGLDLDPDLIRVTLTRYTAAPVAPGQIPQGIPAATSRQSATLSDYAISRFSASQDGLVSIADRDESLPASPLTPEYLRTLVHDLDIAAGYRGLLARTFDPGDAEYVTRLKFYIAQVAPLELLRTCAMRVRHELSELAFRFLEAVLTMPDERLRLPVQDRDVIISPLQLRASPDLAADPVPGAFIIAPRAPQQGPWLLYTQYNADFLLQEYASQQALLDDIHHGQDLQAFILERIDPDVRRLYDHGGFMEPHLPFSTESDLDVPWSRPAPVSLAIEPVTGNALHALFASTGQVLQWWFYQLSATNGEDERLATQFLLTLGTEQVLSLLPGRLGALVGLWQSHSLLHASVADMAQMQWGKAASELFAAVGVLITSRRSGQESVIEPEPESEFLGQEGVVAERRPRLPDFGWGNNSLTPELWARLRPYAVQDLAVETLRKDSLFNTYNDPLSGHTYASVSGAIYRVEKDEYGWFIVGEHDQGPRIVLRQQQWQLNLQRGLRGGGAVVTRIKGSLINAEVDHVMIVEARGMTEIRAMYRRRAMDIAQAHDLAREYLGNSLDNLTWRRPDGHRHLRVREILQNFFDTPEPDEPLYEAVTDVARRLYGALMDASLSPFNSDRYVVGVRRSSVEETTAFSFPDERHKRIYLTERFFRDPAYRLKPHVLSHNLFSQGTHYRATTLVHELSHLYCATEDIAYLDAQVPFPDLIEDNSDYRRMLKNDIVTRQRGLSWRTPRSELFRVMRDDGLWYDLTESNAENKVLQITGKRNLQEARERFYADLEARIGVILGNADSVALLMTLLGRERLVP